MFLNFVYVTIIFYVTLDDGKNKKMSNVTDSGRNQLLGLLREKK